MNLSALDLGLWVASLIGQPILLTVLVLRHRWRGFPVFTTYMLFCALREVCMYLLYWHSLWDWYKRVYWTAYVLDYAMQLGVIWEIARIVLRPAGNWVPAAKRQFILWSAAAILLAAVLPWLVSPASSNLVLTLAIRADIFTGALFCELFLALLLTSKSMGLGWRNHVMGLAQGWSVWAIVAILVNGLHSFYGAERYFREIEHLQVVAYLFALAFWIVQFWRDEPARRPISPELRAYLLDLHRKIKKDIDSLDVQR